MALTPEQREELKITHPERFDEKGRLLPKWRSPGGKGKTKITGKLVLENQKQTLKNYTDPNSKTYLNMVQSVRNGYEHGQMQTYGTSSAIAVKLRKNPNFQLAMKEAFEAHGIDDVAVANEHAKLIFQDEDNGTKMAAIKEYNRVK